MKMLNSNQSPLSGPLSAPLSAGPPHFVDLHVNPGESVSIQLFDGNETILRGPATITMISQHTFPPIPMPVQVPPGHMIQQIVDENGTLRHIILSALNNNGSSTSNGSIMQSQQQQPFPYCCCCCYSCTGTTPSTPLPPPPPPPPPPQVHHNILAFPPPATRRRLPARTYSPAGKRAPPAFYNNNSIGKSPVRNKLGTTTSAAPVDGVSKVSYPKSTAPEGKPYELNSNQVLVGKLNHNDNCLSVTNACITTTASTAITTNGSKEPFDAIRKGMVDNDKDHVKVTKSTQQFAYLSTNESADVTKANNVINCSQTVNICNDSPVNVCDSITNNCIENKQSLSTDVNVLLSKNGDKYEMSTHSLKDINEILHEESLPNCEQHVDVKNVVSREDGDQIVDQNRSSNTPIEAQQTISNVSLIDNQLDINCSDDSNWDAKHTANKSESQLNLANTNKQLESSDSEHYDDESVNADNSIEETERKETNNEVSNEGQALPDNTVKPVSSPQRSPKHLLPQLELLNLTYTSLTANTVKLKWTYSQPHSMSDQLYTKHYVVEMLNKLSVVDNSSQNSQSRIVYQGHSNNCRISHLCSQQQYSFRVRTTSEEHLVVSNVLTITTPEQQPIINKYNKKSKQQLLQQQIQQQQHQIHQQQMLLLQQQQLQEQHTRADHCEQPAISYDQRCAIVLLLLFTLFALIVAVLIQQLLTD